MNLYIHQHPDCAAAALAVACSTIELKKRVVAQSILQTKVQFLCASLKSQLPVISCCTDMQSEAVAYYTTGQRRGDNVCIVREHFFKDSRQMLRWLGTALSAQSVAPNVMRLAADGDIVLPRELPNPKRIRLPVPQPYK